MLDNAIFFSLLLGVPYGEAERFEKPTAYGDFRTDPQNATNFGNICPQRSGGLAVGSENCLNLNIYAPRVKNGELKVLSFTFIF